MAVVTTETSSTGDGHPQQDGGDIGASVIDHLPAGVSVQCKLYATIVMRLRIHLEISLYIAAFFKTSIIGI